MNALRWIGLAAALALVLSITPAALGIHHVGPPDETGMGGGDVTDEPNHGEDLDSSSNGLKACDPSCTESTGTLVLDGIYSTGAYPYFLDLNNVLRRTTAEAPNIDHEDRMYPGKAFLSAWWGWWNDKGRGDNLQETGETVPGVVSGEPDGTINDGHDDHQANDGTIYTGPWDEFVWRGENPWANQEWGPLGDKPIYDGGSAPGHVQKDAMYAFIEPGTNDNADWAGLEGGEARVGLLTNDADGAKRPDLRMSDRTNQAPNGPGPYPHNSAGYGWMSEFGYWHYQYDKSLVVASTISWQVNPDSEGAGLYTPDSGEKVDTDAYASLHPQLEKVYRQAVWDPGNAESSPTDAVHEEGPKEFVTETYHGSDTIVTQASDLVFDVIEPATPALGAADDAAKKPWPHEPSTADDTHAADFDGGDSYGLLAGDDPQQYYENPDGDADYAPYSAGFQPWLDAKAKMASLQFAGILRLDNHHNAFPVPADGDGADRSAPPGILFVTANLGAWQDANGDNWIGDLGETGRPTYPDAPYANGRVDDPNDYTDTPQVTETSSVKDAPAEWRGAGQKATLTATVRPICDDAETNDQGECPWGATTPPAGVYVLEDRDTQNYNPYDDAVEDVIGYDGPQVGPINEDEDGEQLSQHVQYGPITVDFVFDAKTSTGSFNMEENIVVPTGSLNFPVKVTAEGTLGQPSLPGDADLDGAPIVDVDRLEPSAVGG